MNIAAFRGEDSRRLYGTIGLIKRAILAIARSRWVTIMLIALAMALPAGLRLALSPILRSQLPYVMLLPFVLLVAVIPGWKSVSLVGAGPSVLAVACASTARFAQVDRRGVVVILFVLSSALTIVMGRRCAAR